MANHLQIPTTCEHTGTECLVPMNSLTWDSNSSPNHSETAPQHPWILNAVLEDPDNLIETRRAQLGHDVKAALAISANRGGWYAWEDWARCKKCCFNPLLRINTEAEGSLLLWIEVYFLRNNKIVDVWKGAEYQLKVQFEGTTGDFWADATYWHRSKGLYDKKSWDSIEWNQFRMTHKDGEDYVGLGLRLKQETAHASPVIVGELLIDP